MSLTRDQILEMPAGPEMDTLVAERVMGWEKSCNISDGPKGVPLDCWHRWNESDHEFFRETGIKPLGGGSDCVQYQSTSDMNEGGWSPSRDIAAAWEVLVELRRRFCCVRLAFDYHYRSAIKVALKPEHDEWLDIELDAGQEPLLISRAALLATLVQP